MASNASTTAPTTETPTPTAEARPPRTLAFVRLALGWVFLWSFLDKTFGLGYNTPADRGWIDGGSPTAAFFSDDVGGAYSAVAGEIWADWLFMTAMGGLGIALTLGVVLRLAAIGGAILMAALWASLVPSETNPIVDPHFIYAAILIAFIFTDAGDRWGLGRPWRRIGLVRRFPILR